MSLRPQVLCSALALALILVQSGGLAFAQTVPEASPAQPPPRLPGGHGAAPVDAPRGILYLGAFLGANDTQPVRAGLRWRVFEENAGPDGSHKLVTESFEAAPSLPLPDGTYIVHAALGLAGVTKRVRLSGTPVTERLVLNAGGLRIVGMLGDTPLSPARLAISIYVPERGNSEAKLILANGRSGDVIGLPEGNYHVVSTLLDAGNTGSANSTNSVVNADLRVQAGKLTDATLRHRAAVMTLKLVSNPGGDVIREMIGAFPSLVLAEGEYVAIARHDNKTYQATFKVDSTFDRDVEVLAK